MNNLVLLLIRLKFLVIVVRISTKGGATTNEATNINIAITTKNEVIEI